MVPGHPGELYFLAFDHRGSFAREILGSDGELSDEDIQRARNAKEVIFEGLLRAVRRGTISAACAGVLVDERLGGEIPKLARASGINVAIAVERSSQRVFEFEYGPSFGEHIERVAPTFAKVLVRFNVEGDEAKNALQLERLKVLFDFIAAGETKLMYELLVPPTTVQLERCGGELERYRRELRPALIVAGIAAAQDAGIEADVWKLEGVHRHEDAAAVAAAARAGPSRERVRCLLLGAGAPQEQVDRWIEVAAATEGYGGFAIGRSIWSDPIRRLLAGALCADAAAATIASRFVRIAERWKAVRTPNPTKAGPALEGRA